MAGLLQAAILSWTEYSPEVFRLFAWGFSIIRLKPFDYSLEAFRVISSTCSSVLMSSKKHVLLFSYLQKNMFFCSYIFKKNMFFCSHVFKKTCSSVLMSSKKHVLLLREQQEHAFKAFTEVLYRLIRDFTEVWCNIWDIY